MPRIYGTPGLFGSIIYRNENGEIVGESREGIIPGSSDFYDAEGNHIGYGVESVFGGNNLYTDDNGFAGYTQPSLFGDSIHDADGNNVGYGYDGLFGPNVDLDEPSE